MRKSLHIPLALTLLAAGAVVAHEEGHGPKVATVHDIMEVAQKPAMDQLAVIMKAGGPQAGQDWLHAAAYASILARTTKLLLQDGVIKDEVWKKGADDVIASAKASIAAAEAKDVNAWRAAAGGIGRGCRGCHNKHKPKKEEKKG